MVYFCIVLVLSVQGSPFECDRSQLQSIGCRDVQSPVRQASLFLDCSCVVAVALVETSWLHVSPDVFSKHRFRKAMPIVLSMAGSPLRVRIKAPLVDSYGFGWIVLDLVSVVDLVSR